MQVTLQYFSKKEDRELDMLLKIAFGGAGFTFVRKLLDKGGACMDYVFENTDLKDPDERLACIDCTLGTFKSRVDSKGRCLVCQQTIQNPDVKTEVKKVLDEEQGEESIIIRKMVEAHLGDLVTFEYTNTRDERSEMSVRKVAARIRFEKPVTEKDLKSSTENLGRSGEDVEL